MRAVGIKLLKNKLSQYIRLAASGETILVTDRDQVVAEIGPPQHGRAAVSDALLAEAMRNGSVTAPVLPRHGVPQRAPVARFADLLRDIANDREDR